MEKPTSSATIGSIDVVSVSKATRPAAYAFMIQASRCSRVTTVSYFERSNGAFAAAAASAAPAAGDSETTGSLCAFSTPGAARPLVGTVAPTETSTGAGGSAPRPSAMRRVRVLNSMTRRKPSSSGGSGSRTPSASAGIMSGTSSLRRTSSRETRAWSANSISFSRRFGCLISPARASNASRSPYSLISSAAVLTPMPGTPGTLSVESPASDCTSTTFSGGTPNFSITSSRPIFLPFMASSMTTPGRTSCIKSLSEETMVTSPPASTISRA